MLRNIKYSPQSVLKKAIIPELYIDKDLEQLDVNSNIKIKLKYNTKLILETTQEKVKTKIALKSRG